MLLGLRCIFVAILVFQYALPMKSGHNVSELKWPGVHRVTLAKALEEIDQYCEGAEVVKERFLGAKPYGCDLDNVELIAIFSRLHMPNALLCLLSQNKGKAQVNTSVLLDTSKSIPSYTEVTPLELAIFYGYSKKKWDDCEMAHALERKDDTVQILRDAGAQLFADRRLNAQGKSLFKAHH